VADTKGLSLSDEEAALIAELARLDVPFMIVGMGAAVLQGADTVTQDIDLWFRSTSHPGVSEAARKVGGVFAWRNNPPAFLGRGLDGVDVVFNPHGLSSFDDEYEGALDVPFVEGMIVKVLPIDRVIASKRAADRQKDRNVIPALEAALAAIRARTKK
jgi:hypothetical protein